MSNKKMELRDWLIDAGVALAAFVFAYVQLYLSTSPIVFHDANLRDAVGILTRNPSTATYVALAATTLPLALRRKLPWPVFLLVVIVFSSAQDNVPGYAFSVIGPVIAMFTLAYERPRNEIVTAGVVALALLLIARIPSDNDSVAAVVRIQNITFVAAALVAGVAARTYQSYVAAAEQRALEAERSRDAEAARRVEEERVRIAREIHDITAHSLSAVSIQAAAAEKLLDVNPQAAREAISQVRHTSKTALEEIRSMIGVLRAGSTEEAETVPTNGTERMPDLLDYARGAGLQVHAGSASYDSANVPAYADVALFGIAREAVTNVVRHAQAKNLWITLWADAAHVGLLVEDDGVGRAPGEYDGENTDPRAHHGVDGMEERVKALHGQFRAGNRRGGGFEVRVSLPIEGAENTREDATLHDTIVAGSGKDAND